MWILTIELYLVMDYDLYSKDFHRHDSPKCSGKKLSKKLWFHFHSYIILENTIVFIYEIYIHIYPTPTLGQDITQCQFCSGI